MEWSKMPGATAGPLLICLRSRFRANLPGNTNVSGPALFEVQVFCGDIVIFIGNEISFFLRMTIAITAFSYLSGFSNYG